MSEAFKDALEKAMVDLQKDNAARKRAIATIKIAGDVPDVPERTSDALKLIQDTFKQMAPEGVVK